MRERSSVPRPFVLIADDVADTREMYALYLSMSGYGVKIAEDGHEAVIQARTLRPDLIVMDLHMPKLDGWGAIRELQSRAETSSIPVIVLTGHDFKAYLKPAALVVGACSFLMKPCFPEQLAREVATRLGVLRNRPAQRVIGASE
jgi:CheY-like chemotaxis protein